MARSDKAGASRVIMGHWFGSARVALAIVARWFGLANAPAAAGRLDSQADAAPAGAADHWGNWKREDQQEGH